MSKQIAKNTFTGGLQMDLHPLSSQNTVLTNALNATLVTIDGDEMILQNDMGNLKAIYTEDGEEYEVTLTEDFIPIGINTLNGVAYIVSFNPNTQEGEIGTFPSPQYNINSEGILANDKNEDDNGNDRSKLINKYQPLYNLYKGKDNNGIGIDPKQEKDIENLLFPMRTTHFNFDLEHPVDIELQVSYDDSVNIILNDGKNIPRLINSRFAVQKDGTWKIPDRHKNTDNVYKVNANYKLDTDEAKYSNYNEPACVCEEGCDCNEEDNTGCIKDVILSECNCTPVSCKQEVSNQSIFDITTSLNKRVEIFPVVKYEGLLNTGDLPVGNYVLYFKYCDEDGNETDFVAESGIISIFKGIDCDPFSIDGGERDMDSNKSIRVSLRLIDSAYSYVKVYYTRTSAAADENRVVQAFEIKDAFEISDKPDSEGYNVCHITITGNEAKTQIDVNEINQPYTIVNSAETQAQTNNIFFMANIKAQKLYYKELTNLSLRVIPYFNVREESERIGHVRTHDYSNFYSERSEALKDPLYFEKEYYNTKNIYYNVGYWNEEYYRLGIVYIYEDGSLSPVFNTLGYEMQNPTDCYYTNENNENKNFKPLEVSFPNNNFEYLDIEESGFIDPDKNEGKIEVNFVPHTLNARGVVRINYDERKFKYEGRDPEDLIKLYNLGVYIPSELISELKNKYCIKGFFIVRQKRIPTILAQGFTLPWDKESKVPIVEYWGRGLQYKRGRDEILNSSDFTDYKDYLKYYDETYNIKEQSDEDKKFLLHKMYFVESFLRQSGHETDDDHEAFSKESDTDSPFDRLLTQDYIYRLHNILPCCVDAKMIAGSDEKRVLILPTMYYQIEELVGEKIDDFKRKIKDSSELSDEEIDKVIEEIVNRKFSTLSQLQGFLKEGIVARVKRKVISSIGQVMESMDAILDPEIIPDVQEFRIVEEYYDAISGRHSETYQGLASQLDISDFDTSDPEGIAVQIHARIGYTYSKNPEDQCNCTTFTDTTCECVSDVVMYELKNSFIKNASNIDEVYDINGGYLYTSYTIRIGQESWSNNPDYKKNYYYTHSLASKCTGYIVQPNEGCEYRDIGAYYVNWKLCKDPDDEDPNYIKDKDDLTDDKAKIKHYTFLYKYVDENQLTAICPEFEVRQPFFNQLFTGTEFTIKYNVYQQGLLVRDPSKERYYFSVNPGLYNGKNDFYQNQISKSYNDYKGNNSYRHHKFDVQRISYKIVGVTDSVPVVAIDNTIFKAVCGDAAEAYRFEYINEEHCPRRDNSSYHGDFWSAMGVGNDNYNHNQNESNQHDFNLVRGLYSPYLGIVASGTAYYIDKYNNNRSCDKEKLRGYSKTFTIYDNSYNNNDEQTNFLVRMQDTAPYYTISERVSLDYLEYVQAENRNGIPSFDFQKIKRDEEEFYIYNLFRGDSFICTFTHRLNRNFQDPTAPQNDKIINYITWRDHYQPDDKIPDTGVSELAKINRGDINAVKLGSWITIKVRCSYNLSIRSLDERHLSESALMGRARGFYPLQQASADGGYKIPNSYLINDGFGSTVGEKIYHTLPEAPYIQEEFSNRIVYSDVNVENSFRNGYRTYRYTSTETYTKQYGKIVKLVPWYGHLICVFEHAVAVLPINERVESGEGVGGPVFINTNRVLPNSPSIISDKFGSQWKDSIIKTPYAIYGVDSSTKKIWKITGSTTLPTLSVISDFKVENFLKEHLPTKDNDTSMCIALRNIKSHYNQTKADVIFTFYMDMEHDRLVETSEEERKKYDEEAWSLCLNEIISDQSSGNSANFVTFYSWIPLESFNLNNKFYSFDRDLVRGILSFPKLEKVDEPIKYIGKPLYNENGELVDYNEVRYCCGDTDYYTKSYKPPLHSCLLNGLNIWEHNNPFIRPLPTHWYGKQHPFEFEFIVIEDPSVQKIYEDMKIVSNNAKPESFHFAISGDNYEFTEDLPNIYYRQEATKELYSNKGCPISYNKDYQKVHPNQLIKSTIFPLYYNRLDIYDNIYDLYQQMTNPYRDYQNLSGTEVYRNPRSGKFEIVTHIKNTPIDGEWVRLIPENIPELLVQFEQFIPERFEGSWEKYVEYLLKQRSSYDDWTRCEFEDTLNRIYDYSRSQQQMFLPSCYPKIKKIKNPRWAFNCSCERYWYYIWIPQSRLRGNSHYKEDKWNIQIPSITLMQKNEKYWKSFISEFDGTIISVPPIVLNWIPKLKDYQVQGEDLPNTYSIGQLSTDKWTFRKETKIRDKYCKIKVRYSGEELAIISAVLTTFNISYA